MSSAPDRNEAKRFLAALDPGSDRWTFQTFDDDQQRKDKSRARILHGTLEQHWDTLVKLNTQGAGVFITVNATDLKGRSGDNITRVRAGFVDLDGAEFPDPPHVLPHVIVESSPERWHIYWRVKDVPVPVDKDEFAAIQKQFAAMQKRLSLHYGSDQTVHDLPRVMRLPGFYHRKAAPFLSRLVEVNDEPAYTLDQVVAGLPELKTKTAQPKTSGGDSFWNRVNTAALADRGGWVSALFPTASYHESVDCYRVTSHDLGRALEEDVVIGGDGIRDCGREKGLTPIDAVLEFGTERTPQDAALWLCGQLGLQPETLGYGSHPTRSDQQQQHKSNGKGNGGSKEHRRPRGEDGTRASVQAAGPLFDPWERYIVPPFPFEVLPPIARDYVAAQSTVIGCDASAMAMAVLATFSGALHHGFQLKMMRHGAWYERPRLWVLLVADPSQRKTPIMNAATVPLAHYETHLRVKYEADLRDYEMAKAQMGEDDPEPRKPDLPPRFIVWDTTVEKLGELLDRSPKGLLVKSDEISGWLGNMERYNAGRSDRGFWLCAYDGGPHSVDRIKRGEMFIKNLSVSLLGSIQPARLAELQGLTSDGLLQRFLLVMMGSASLAQDSPSDDERYSALVRELIFAKPARLIMSDHALAIMAELRQHLFNLEQASGGLAPGFQSFVGKLHGVAGSLALILHMAHDPQTGATYPIDELTISNVRKLVVDFILPHAFEFYRAGEAEGDRLRRLSSWILTSRQQRVLASDLARNIMDFRGLTLVQINERVSPLVAAGWLIPADATPVCRAWTVAAQVHTQLAERAKIEDARKQVIAKLMGSPRKGHR